MNFSEISFGIFDLQLVGLAWGMAFAYFSWKFYRLVKKNNLDVNFFVHHFWRWILAGIIFGRLVALLVFPDIFVRFGLFAFFAFWEEQINAFGFLLGFLGFMCWDLQHRSMSIWKWLDLATFPFLGSLLFMDLCFFFTGSIYGRETNLPWGVTYETFGVELISPLHPVTLYSFVAHFILFKILKRRQKSLYNHEGKLFKIMIFWTLFIDFFIQFYRYDRTLYLFSLVRIDQIMNLVCMGFLLWIYHQKWGLKSV